MSIQALYIAEGTQPQWKGESIAYTVTTTPWATSPTVTQFKLYGPAESDVTVAQTSGSASVSGDVITTPKIVPSSIGYYRWVITFTSGGLTYIVPCNVFVVDPLDFV